MRKNAEERKYSKKRDNKLIGVCQRVPAGRMHGDLIKQYTNMIKCNTTVQYVGNKRTRTIQNIQHDTIYIAQIPLNVHVRL